MIAEKATDNIGKAVYGLVDSGLFGFRVISGVVTGLRFTEDKPLYEVSFGKNSWWTPDILDNIDDLGKLFNLAPIERIKETHGLRVKFDK